MDYQAMKQASGEMKEVLMFIEDCYLFSVKKNWQTTEEILLRMYFLVERGMKDKKLLEACCITAILALGNLFDSKLKVTKFRGIAESACLQKPIKVDLLRKHFLA